MHESSTVQLDLTETVPPIDPPKDTRYVRHLRVQSKLLTVFWGHPIFLEAAVLVPRDFDDSKQHYPVAFLQGHFGGDFFGFRDTPPAGDAGSGRDAVAYQFYQDWTSGRLPRMLLVVTSHPTPYYDDSYGVNTANAGPYGDALTKELYPAVEKEFRGIGESWARVVFGGSTGGWMTLAQQIFYPEYFGGAWGFCPDPVDFHAFQSIDVYADTNAYYDQGPFERFPKLLGRLPNDHLLGTMESSGSKPSRYCFPVRSASTPMVSHMEAPSESLKTPLAVEAPWVWSPKNRVSGRPRNAIATASPELPVPRSMRRATLGVPASL
ncbi:MAG TPA: alpha/beta hydrolase-fold protein [Candidatus Acidoferrales bacterium]|nr:alpha/beta hydrolase-fold protein [Candidatus Acidoferrales bacterium]